MYVASIYKIFVLVYRFISNFTKGKAKLIILKPFLDFHKDSLYKRLYIKKIYANDVVISEKTISIIPSKNKHMAASPNDSPAINNRLVLNI